MLTGVAQVESKKLYPGRAFASVSRSTVAARWRLQGGPSVEAASRAFVARPVVLGARRQACRRPRTQ